MSWTAISKRKFMEASEEAISAASEKTTATHAVAIDRILENPTHYQTWESQHNCLMGRVAKQRNVRAQLYHLRDIAMSQVHGKALFEVMRAQKLNAQERNFLIKHLHGPVDVINATIAEHKQFIRASASHYCVMRIGENMMHDAVFDSWLRDYENAYNGYISLYVGQLLDQAKLRFDPSAEFTPGMKRELASTRSHILSLPRLPKYSRSGHELRAPVGDTQRMRRPNLRWWNSETA